MQAQYRQRIGDRQGKKEFSINNSKELKEIRDKYIRLDDNGRTIKPNFFGAKDKGKGYYDTKRKNYMKHCTTMDYLQTEINKYARDRKNKKDCAFIPFADIIDDGNYVSKMVVRKQAMKIFDCVQNGLNECKSVWMNESNKDSQLILTQRIKDECINYVANLKISKDTMIYLLRMLDKPDTTTVRRFFMNTLFGVPNSCFYEMLKKSSEPLKQFKYDEHGEYKIYNRRYKKVMCSGF